MLYSCDVHRCHGISPIFASAVLQALDHDVLNTAKAAAYSGMLMLFPALLVRDHAAGPGAGGQHAGGRDAHASSSSFCPPTSMDCCSRMC